MNFFNDLLENITGYYSTFVAFLPKLVIGLIVFFIFWWIGSRTKKFFKSRLAGKIEDQLLKDFLSRITKFIWIAIGFLIFLKILGWGDAAAGILATASVTAFIIGFAFKDIGENFLAGIVMAFNPPFKVGDVIQTNGVTGKITSMSLRETMVKSFEGRDVYIPNGLIIKTPLQNYTIDGFLRFDFDLRLDHAADFNKAGQIVLEQLRNIPGVLQEEKTPDVTITGLGPDEATMKVYFWINTFDPNTSVFKIKTDAFQNCIKALREVGIHIPNQVVELKK